MIFDIEKYISNFVRNQFPAFYNEEGELFILFMQAYYEWMEENGNPIHEARMLMDYRDVDNTLVAFLEHFQKKYLYSIPYNIISDKRQLVKHILDVYRSKTNLNCYKLLFRMVYDEDVDVYIPGYDLLRPSDGIWIEPRYIEVTKDSNLARFVGKRVYGISSGVTAVVESYIRESFNKDTSNVLYISNVLPKGEEFTPGERVVLYDERTNANSVSASPFIIGSLDSLDITNGGQGFKVGDIIKIADRSFTNGSWISYGTRGLLKVTKIIQSTGYGSLNFNVIGGGFGFAANAATFVYRGPGDLTGNGAAFTVGYLSSPQSLQYNTDLIADYANSFINATAYGFPGNTAANVSTNVGIAFLFENNTFGVISSIALIGTGNNYTTQPNVFVRSVTPGRLPLQGSITYSTTSNTVSGVGTIFTQVFQPGQAIYIQSNSSLSTTGELHVVKSVTSDTQLELYGPPKFNSTASAIHKIAPSVLGSQYAIYELPMYSANNTINGLNELIEALPSIGNNIITSVKAIDSGLGYVDGENVKAYLYSAVSNTVVILDGGTGYTNGDILVFAGSGSFTPANGFVTTNANGTITQCDVVYAGSGYMDIPVVRVQTATGKNANLKARLTSYNLQYEVQGRVIKTGIGKGRGYWTTTKSFLNSDKYIQDSYYYQDYSYEIRTGLTLNKYKEIIYDTFHHTGNQLFGRYVNINEEDSTIEILYEDGVANTTFGMQLFLVDTTLYSVDLDYITADKLYIY